MFPVAYVSFGGLLDMLAFYLIFMIYRLCFSESIRLSAFRAVLIGLIAYGTSIVCLYFRLPWSVLWSMLITVLLLGKRKLSESVLILPAIMVYTVLAVIPALMLKSIITVPYSLVLSSYGTDMLGIGMDLLGCIGVTALCRALRRRKISLLLRPAEVFGFILFFFFEVFLLMGIAVIRVHYAGTDKLFLNGCCFFFFLLAMGAYLWQLVTLRRVRRLDVLVKQEEDYIQCQLSWLEQYRNENQSIRALRHDLRGHLQMLKSLQESGQKKRTEQYLDSLQAETDRIRELEFAGDQAADIVLAGQKKRAQEAGIPFVCGGSFPWMEKLKPMEVCSLLSNLLDNAYEASLAEAEPDISVKGGAQEHFWTFTVSNRAEKERAVRNNRLSSAKGGNHGMGLDIVQQIVERYGGICCFSWEDHRFFCRILFPRGDEG